VQFSHPFRLPLADPSQAYAPAFTELATEPASPPSGSSSEPAPLTYRVYTLADLDGGSRPPSMRPSRIAFESSVTRSLGHARRVTAVTAGFLGASLAWARSPAPRPDPRVALRTPFDVMGDELEVVARAIDWKRLGVLLGIVLGATLTLLFVVLTAAELTDDLRPAAARPASQTSVTLASPAGALAPGATPVAVAPARPAAVAPAPVYDPASFAAQPQAAQPTQVVEPTMEVDDEPAPAAAKKSAAAKRGAGGGKKPGKLTFRNAEEIFNP